MLLFRSAVVFSAGFAAGAAASENLPKLKEKFGPRVAELRDLIGDACTEAASKASEVDELQTAMNQAGAPRNLTLRPRRSRRFFVPIRPGPYWDVPPRLARRLRWRWDGRHE